MRFAIGTPPEQIVSRILGQRFRNTIAQRIRIQTRYDEPVQFDGEEGGTTRDLSIKVVPGAVRVLIPENAPAARDSDEPPALVARKTAERRLIVPAALLIAGVFGVGLWAAYRRRSSRKGRKGD